MPTNMVIEGAASELATDVRNGLMKSGQKELPSKHLYDDIGSKLFELICDLPEYGVTRADERLLRRHAGEIAARVSGNIAVAELGSGSGRKTRWILEALSGRRHTNYFPIEISPTALDMCRRELSDIGALSIIGFEREYLDGLLEVVARREAGQRFLILFLGSTIGNFDFPADVEFLRQIRLMLQPGDFLLLGTDLEKPTPRLIAAYDDPIGVTSAFNKNLLARINRELDGNFALDRFAHEARFNTHTGSVEMHLRSLARQRVNIPQAQVSVDFEEGETIWTESSHKYGLKEVIDVAGTAGFRCDKQWIDREWPFSENLLIAE